MQGSFNQNSHEVETTQTGTHRKSRPRCGLPQPWDTKQPQCRWPAAAHAQPEQQDVPKQAKSENREHIPGQWRSEQWLPLGCGVVPWGGREGVLGTRNALYLYLGVTRCVKTYVVM